MVLIWFNGTMDRNVMAIAAMQPGLASAVGLVGS